MCSLHGIGSLASPHPPTHLSSLTHSLTHSLTRSPSVPPFPPPPVLLSRSVHVVISATGLAIDRIAALDHSLDQLATDLNVVSTWADEFHVATDNVTNHTLATQAYGTPGIVCLTSIAHAQLKAPVCPIPRPNAVRRALLGGRSRCCCFIHPQTSIRALGYPSLFSLQSDALTRFSK